MNKESSFRILMICTRFARPGESPYLTDELADALQAGGARVAVAVLDWSGAARRGERLVRENGVEAVFVPAFRFPWLGSRVAAGLRWALSSLLGTPVFRRAYRGRQFDAVIAFSPLVVSGFSILWARAAFRARGFAYITDFFPFHQAAIGMVGGLAGRMGLRLETALMRRFETVACMSPAGVKFLRQHYRLPAAAETPVLRLWGPGELADHDDRTAARFRFRLPEDRPIVVFGGQLVEGRGIEDMLAAAALADGDSEDDTLFLFLGAGRLEGLIGESGLANVELRPPVSREDYLPLIAACDIGLVSTVAGTGVPTFPSKTIDYLRAGLPVVASVETTTDYRDFVAENGFGMVVDAGDPATLRAAVRSLVAQPAVREEMRAAGRVTLQRHFDVDRSARRLLAHLKGDRGPDALSPA